MNKIVVLDGYTLNPGDIKWNKLEALGELNVHRRTPSSDIVKRAKDANILIVNKVVLDKDTLKQLKHLKLICVSATGYNNVDLETATELDITVCNVAGYSTESVAQHVFSMLLYFTNQVASHNKSVMDGNWEKSKDFTYSLKVIQELKDLTMGIYGLGRIGNKLADIALAFNMKVIAHHKHPERDKRKGVEFVSWEGLLRKSDVLSLHAPLTDANTGIINQENLSKMKPSAYLINTGRGGLINEIDLKEALENKIIAGAGIDVLSEEPPKNGNVLIGAKNCLITPHQAWTSKSARIRLLDGVIGNIRAYIAGKPTNVVNPS